MTTLQAAERLGVSRQEVQRLITAGRLKAEKIGRDWIVDKRSIAAYERNRRGPGRPHQ